MGIIFQKQLLDKFVEECLVTAPPQEHFINTVRKWKDYFEGRSQLGEASLEQAFNEDFFCRILEYRGPPAASFTFLPKRSAREGRYIPDFMIGFFSIENGQLSQDVRKVVGELKGPEVDLDKINPSRKKTPVEQAFEYGRNNGIYVDWIIVSNMREIRLYKNTSIVDYEEFIITRFMENSELTKDFWKFYFLLHHDNFLKNAPDNKVYNLLLENLEERTKISEAFYNYYRECLLDLYNELSNIHSGLLENIEGQLKIAQCSQKLLHRGLLICFMSDHPQRILPKNILEDIIEAAINYPSLEKDKIYQVLKVLFRCIDLGSPRERARAQKKFSFGESIWKNY